jgi:hypothetical protein
LAAGTIFHRFYLAAYSPVFFDTSNKSRFNASDGSYGVLYGAMAADGAFAEVFLRKVGATNLGADFVRDRAYVRLETIRDLKLVEMHGPGLAVLGATAEVTHSGLPYDVAQDWSKGLHRHPGSFDGIAYRSRHDDAEICYAIFDRAASAIAEDSRVTVLDTDWFWDLTDKYKIGVV